MATSVHITQACFMTHGVAHFITSFLLTYANLCIITQILQILSLSLAAVKSKLALVPAQRGNPGQSPECCKKDLCVCVCLCVCV